MPMKDTPANRERCRILKAVLKSEFCLEVESVLLRSGQHYVDLQVHVGLPALDETLSWSCNQVPADAEGHLDWARWLRETTQPADPDYPEPWLVQHWLEMGMLPTQLTHPL